MIAKSYFIVSLASYGGLVIRRVVVKERCHRELRLYHVRGPETDAMPQRSGANGAAPAGGSLLESMLFERLEEHKDAITQKGPSSAPLGVSALGAVDSGKSTPLLTGMRLHMHAVQRPSS